MIKSIKCIKKVTFVKTEYYFIVYNTNSYCFIIGEWWVYQDDRFLLTDNGWYSRGRIIIFSTDDCLRLLADADTW